MTLLLDNKNHAVTNENYYYLTTFACNNAIASENDHHDIKT